MSHSLKTGDRVRITHANTMPGYRAGDEGTVNQGPYPSPLGGRYYVVLMDQHAGGGPAIFLEEEIEPAT